jgi:hypothetical protein
MVNLAGLELLLQQLKDKEDIETDKNCLTGDKQRSTKHTYKTKDRVTRTPLNNDLN